MDGADVGTAPLVQEIVHRVPEGRLDEVFLNTYNKRSRSRERTLLKAVQNAEALTNWRYMLQQIIAAYRRRHYLVVVPALLTVFEGAVAASAKRSDQRVTPSRIASELRDRLDPGIVRLAWVSIHGFVSGIFAAHSFAASPPTLLNRHWILHG